MKQKLSDLSSKEAQKVYTGIALALVAELGSQWRPIIKEWTAMLYNESENIYLEVHRPGEYTQRDRIAISQSFSPAISQLINVGERPEITVSAERLGATIAKDVTRRLLPQCYAKRDDVMQRYQEEVAYRNKLAINRKRVVEALGRWTDSSVEDDNNVVVSVNMDLKRVHKTCYGHVRVSKNVVHLKLDSLPIDVAVEFLTWLAQKKEQGEA